MNDTFLHRLIAVSGALAVALGAFGAHFLKPLLTVESLEVWRTANLYHFLHTVALLVLLALPARFHRHTPLLWMAGIVLFSGSLYLLATREAHGWPVAWLGPVTPLGGILFMAGWLSLLFPSHPKTHPAPPKP